MYKRFFLLFLFQFNQFIFSSSNSDNPNSNTFASLRRGFLLGQRLVAVESEQPIDRGNNEGIDLTNQLVIRIEVVDGTLFTPLDAIEGAIVLELSASSQALQRQQQPPLGYRPSLAANNNNNQNNLENDGTKESSFPCCCAIQ